jgi:hypothetical protein
MAELYTKNRIMPDLAPSGSNSAQEDVGDSCTYSANVSVHRAPSGAPT